MRKIAFKIEQVIPFKEPNRMKPEATVTHLGDETRLLVVVKGSRPQVITALQLLSERNGDPLIRAQAKRELADLLFYTIVPRMRKHLTR